MDILEVIHDCPKEEPSISSFIALFLFLTIILLGVTEKDDE
jgi:hypothetical protein